VGQGKYVLITAPDGGIVNDPVMLRLGENHFWFALASSDALLYAIGLAADLGWDVQLSEPDVSPLQIQGPRSREVVQALFGDEILSLKYYWFRELELDGIPLIVTRTGWTAEVGYEIYLRDGRYGTALWERIMEAGRPFQIRPTGPVDIRRVEGGILNWGADMTIEHNPFEVGLERLCSLDGAFEFAGKAALRRIRDEGVRRRLVGVEIDGEKLEMNLTKWPVHANDGQVGEVTTALWSPRLEKNIGYAWLPVELAGLGNSVGVTIPNGERAATVVPMPFLDPKKEIPKS
jgi:glycine cleavage system aminomethyltransferase T